MTTQPITLPDIQISSKDIAVKASRDSINYNVRNPLEKLMATMEEAYFFAEHLDYYLSDSLQFLFPFVDLQLYGPAGTDIDILNPVNQDNKTDFQKQNIKDFILADAYLVRGWVKVGNETRPFLKLSYQGNADSVLSQTANHKLDAYIFLFLKVQGQQSPDLIKVPYNEDTNRYEVELWGYSNANDFYNQLSEKGKQSFHNGQLLVRNDLIKGSYDDFAREDKDGKNMYAVSGDCTMHPIQPLKIEVAWADHTQTFWDSLNGKNYHYEFGMILRGWNNYMEVGVSANPHGGVGFLHYRNLLSNYKPYTVPEELSREVMPWMFDASGKKSADGSIKMERSLSMDYLDLHILKPECGIGIHRHRDNQEVFFLMTGKAYMMVGDWYDFPGRERAFEIRTLLPGSLALLKAGQLHALVNALDIDATLLMFGGYD